MSETPAKTYPDLSFVAPHPELAAALTFVTKIIPRTPSVPVLGGVVVTCDGETVTVESFDYEQSRRVVLPNATGTRTGTVLVDAKELLAYVKALPAAKPVAFAGTGTHVTVSNGQTTYTLETMPLEDYPTRPALPPVAGVVLAHELAAAVLPVAKHAGRDETLPMMTGVRLSSGKDAPLVLEATDRYRLAVREIGWTCEIGEFAALVPAWTIADVMGTLAKLPDQVVTVRFECNDVGTQMLAFETDTMHVTTRLIDGGNYPPVRKLIPDNPAVTVDVDVPALAATVKRVAVALEKTMPLRFRMTTRFAVEGGKAREVFDGATFVDEPADELVVGMNPAYLLDSLTTLGTKRVRLGFLDAFKPFTIVPLDADGALVPGVTNLLMVIRTTLGDDKSTKADDAAVAALLGAAPVQAPPAKAKPKKAKAKATAAQVQAPAPEAPPVAEPDKSAVQVTAIRAAAAEEVLDRTIEHLFVRAVDNGKGDNPMTRCKCGAIRNAKVHGGRQAAARAAAAEAAGSPAEQPLAVVPEWMCVLQMRSPRGDHMVTEATEAACRAAVRQFGDRSLGVIVHDEHSGKRMYVGTRTEADADLMRTTASAFGIPAFVANGVWPSQSATAGSEQQEDTQVKAHEESPVIVTAKFSAADASKRARNLADQKEFAAALAVVDDAEQQAPGQQFRGGNRTYGWPQIREAIQALQLKHEIEQDAKADAEAKIAAKTPEQPTAKVEVPQQRTPRPAVKPEPTRGVPAVVAGEPTVVARLRAALVETGAPAEVIEVAVAAAVAALADVEAAKPKAVEGAAVKAKKGKKGKAAKVKAVEPVATQPVAPATKAAKPKAAAVVDDERWQALGMAAPTDAAGERTYLLPAGTRLRALRAAVLEGLRTAKAAGHIESSPLVAVDKDARPYRLRVRLAEPGALDRVSDLLDDIVGDALPEFLPAARVAA